MTVGQGFVYVISRFFYSCQTLAYTIPCHMHSSIHTALYPTQPNLTYFSLTVR